jgi:hypothetical protein
MTRTEIRNRRAAIRAIASEDRRRGIPAVVQIASRRGIFGRARSLGTIEAREAEVRAALSECAITDLFRARRRRRRVRDPGGGQKCEGPLAGGPFANHQATDGIIIARSCTPRKRRER